MSAEDCTNYLACAPSPAPFVPTLPPDIPVHTQTLAATGSTGRAFLLVVVALVIVGVVAPLLIIAGRRRNR
jgi:hypothetical protein